MKKVWCFDPQSGGDKIPITEYNAISDQVTAYMQSQKWYPKYQLTVRYKGQFCYVDAVENSQEKFAVCRLRYFGKNSWSIGFFAYSSDSYKPCLFRNGKWLGTLEDAITTCSVYFQ